MLGIVPASKDSDFWIRHYYLAYQVQTLNCTWRLHCKSSDRIILSWVDTIIETSTHRRVKTNNTHCLFGGLERDLIPGGFWQCYDKAISTWTWGQHSHRMEFEVSIITCRSSIRLIFNCLFYCFSWNTKKIQFKGIGSYRQASHINIHWSASTEHVSVACASYLGDTLIGAITEKVVERKMLETSYSRGG